MSSNKDEIERLKRIRDEQLKARDPQAKQKEIQRKVAARQRGAKRSITLGEALGEIPRKWKGFVGGAAIGVVLWIVLPYFVDPPWGDVAGLAAILVLAIFGFMVGQAIDLRADIKELIGD